MLIYKNYDKVSLTEEAFYESSNVFYSKCNDNPNQLKTLLIVFNNGGTYMYYDVDVKDYLKFREADSQGKALNQYITAKNAEGKPKYKFIKLGQRDIEVLKEHMKELMAQEENVQEDEEKQEEKPVAVEKETRHMYITEKADGHVYVKNENGFVVDITKLTPTEVAEKMCNLFRIEFTKRFE